MNKNKRENDKFRDKQNQDKNIKKEKPFEGKIYRVSHRSELLDYLINDLKFSRNVAKGLLSKKVVGVNGAGISQFNFMLYPKDELMISKTPFKKIAPTKQDKNTFNKQIPTNEKLDIIYEDDEFIVINKPYGLLSVSSDNVKEKTAYRLVMDYLQSKDKMARIFVVHRIDKETSGVLMFCKNESIQLKLQDNWNDLVTKRGYFAIVEGKLDQKSGEIVQYLKKGNGEFSNLMYVTNKYDKEAKKAITDYKVIKENNKYSLLDVNILTGRKNQIRIAFGSMGHFVIGEDKYGEPANPLKRLGLHNYSLEFTHPVTKKEYKFITTIPKEFNSLF